MDDPLESNSFPVGSRRVPFLRATPSTKPSDHHRTSSPTLSTAEAQQAQRPPHSCDVGMKMRVGTLDGNERTTKVCRTFLLARVSYHLDRQMAK